MATRECVVQVLDLLVRSKPGARLDDVDAVIEAWCLVLEPLPNTVVLEVAVMLARQKGDFLPSAGTLFDTALDLLDPSPDVSAAWALVKKYAHGDRVELPERVAAALATMGRPGKWEESELPFRRKEFEQRYKDLGQQWREGVSAGRLALPEGRKMIDAPS